MLQLLRSVEPTGVLNAHAFSAIDLREEAKGTEQAGHTENPRRVHWSWDISDRREPPTPSKEDIDEDSCTSREYSELVLHGWFVV